MNEVNVGTNNFDYGNDCLIVAVTCAKNYVEKIVNVLTMACTVSIGVQDGKRDKMHAKTTYWILNKVI